MYPLLLVRHYLTSRVIPLIAVAAVGLCVALVITVVSIMTGFLDSVKASGRATVGDVIVSRALRGIPDYELLITRILAQPEAEAAAPVIESYGLLRMPFPADSDEKSVATVQVWAVDYERFSQVTGLEKNIWWKPPADEAARAKLLVDDPRLRLPEGMMERTRTMTGANGRPGAILGMNVSVGNRRAADGSYRFMNQWWMPAHEVTLTVAPVSSRGRIGETRDLIMPVVNEFASGMYMVDKQRVLIPFAEGQRLLSMHEKPTYDLTAPPLPDGSQPRLGTAPARATSIFVRARPNVTSKQLKAAVERAYDQLHEEQRALPEAARTLPDREQEFVSIDTWEERLVEFIGPVEKEREMMRILFSIIYLVCAGLVLSIFWAIVAEKTRDIGILRAVGAGRSGVLLIFLQYGAAIGVVGSGCGVLLAYVFITNVNTVHQALEFPFPKWLVLSAAALAGFALVGVVWAIVRDSILWTLLWIVITIALAGLATAFFLHEGFVMWDPRVYFFTRIPSRVDWWTAGTTVIGAIIFSVLGASVPAARAADVDPVRALRYE